MKIAFDASTLILLAKTDLLREAAGIGMPVIPIRVRSYVLAGQSPDAELVRVLIREQLIEVCQAPRRAALQIARDFRIHAGEAEALALAIAGKHPLAVDDGPTIKACKALGVPFLTAIHFLLRLAKRESLGQALALEKLRSLSKFGRYKAQIIENASRHIRGGH
jgi:predicted nucleic acid-binding protein